MKKLNIKNIKNRLLLGLVSLILLIASCDILDKEPLDALYEDDIWNNEEFAKMYLNGVYYDLMPKFAATYNQGMSEETGFPTDEDDKVVTNNTSKIYGELTKDGTGDVGKVFYGKIAKVNRLLRDIDEKGSLPLATRQLIKAQGYFLRAWGYWEIVKKFGGIPMVLKVPEVATDGKLQPDLYLKRNKTSECIDIIVADLDSAAKYLPSKWVEDKIDYGRITRGAALALKGRVLLYWASPQFNPDNLESRWQRAYNANKKALEVLENDGYGLYPSFQALFHDCVEKTKEAIFVRVYNVANFNHSYDASVRPSLEGFSGKGLTNNPTWEMVKAFPMADGYPIYDTTGSYTYDTSLYWQNRDPRFEYTVAYNGCVWPLSGKSDYKIWTYYTINGTQIQRDNKTYFVHLTKTGFFCKKYVNPAIAKEACDEVGTDWMEIRFAEVLLNFAECANELDGKNEEVREALYRIRNERDDVKAGMDYIDKNLDNQAIMREAIMTERLVELAFENKRYWDLRRRNMFAEDLGPNIKKLNGTTRSEYRIVLNEEGTSAAEMYAERSELDFNDPLGGLRLYNNKFKRYPFNIDNYSPINYLQPKYNFFPIEKDNILKNPNFEQTNYWGGTFDPLE